MNPQIIEAAVEPSEFSYVLHLLSATSLFGAEQGKLFPTDSEERDDLLAQGLRLLKEHDWLTTDTGQTFNVDPTLMLMVAAAADPRVVVTTKRYMGQGPNRPGNRDANHPLPTQRATHYIAGQARLETPSGKWSDQGQITIEQVLGSDGRYHLISLPYPALAAERVARAFEAELTAADTFEPIEPIVIPSDVGALQAIERSGDAVAVEQLERLCNEWGVVGEQQDRLVSILTAGELVGEIQVCRVMASRVLKAASIAIIGVGDVTWAVTDRADGTHFQPVHGAMLNQSLEKLIETFYQIPYDPTIYDPIPPSQHVENSARG